MKYIAFFFSVLFLASCSSARDSRTRSNIRKEYSSVKKNKPVQKPAAFEQNQVKPAEQVAEISLPVTLPKKEVRANEHLVATSDVTVTRDAIQEYIDQYKTIAMDNMRQYGIPASIKLAQGILESGSGKGRLCREANNHFGIKCKETWTGDYVFHTDDAPDECFRKYGSALDSYKDHSEFLANRVYYKNLFTLDKGDYVAWARGLKKAGYATDPRYPEKLISIIERYNLYEYDKTVLGTTYNVIERINPVADNENYYAVCSGDTLYAISSKFDLSIDELKRINNLRSNALSVGQILKIK